MALHDKGLLVKLTVRTWDGFKKDKTVAQAVDAQYHAKESDGVTAGNYNKRLFDKSVLKPMQSIGSKLRSDHNEFTVPYAYDGVGVLPNKLFFEYGEMFRAHKDALTVAVDNFIQQYPVYKANQANRLGAMFNPEDYPTADQIRSKFSISRQFFPVPQDSHFMLDIAAEELEQVKNEFRNDMLNTEQDATQELYARVTALLDRMYDRLSDPENIFRDSLVTNIKQITQVLPALNMFDDPKLTEAQKRMEQEILFLEAEDLRVDMALRRHVAEQAFDIANFLNGGEAPNGTTGSSESESN